MSVVYGLDGFRAWMKGCDDCYMLIGGGACSLLFEQRGEDFRLTRDLDIVVLTDRADKKFAQTLWSYLSAGGYNCGGRNDTAVKYYRFTLPEDRLQNEYPQMIELFAKHPDFRLENEFSEITPLPFDEDISSLSAIMLDDTYYDFLCSGLIKVADMPIVDALHIIPLKMRAHLDLNDRHIAGEWVKEKDLRKHRSDVLSLSRLLSEKAQLALKGAMIDDAERFLQDALAYAGRMTRARDVHQVEETVDFLRGVYL